MPATAPSIGGPATAQQRPTKNPLDTLMSADGSGLHPVVDMLAKHLYGPKMQAAAAQVQPQAAAPMVQPAQGYNPMAGGAMVERRATNPPTNPYISRNPLDEGPPRLGPHAGKFGRRFRHLFPFILSQMEPERIRSAEAAALGGQTALQTAQAGNARLGLGGSGWADTQVNAINAGTQAQIHQALTTMYEQAIQEAISGSFSRKRYRPNEGVHHHEDYINDAARLYQAYTSGKA